MQFILIVLIVLIGLIGTQPAWAQNQAIDVSSTYEIADNEAQDGDILIHSDQGIIRAAVAFDNRLFGVLQNTPLLVFKSKDSTAKPVVRTGVAFINVTNTNGAIKIGDYITSSNNSGKGQKANQSGYVIGTALEDMNEAEGKIQVALKIEYAELTNTRSVLRIIDYFNIAAFQGAQDPSQAPQLIKYSSSGVIVLASLIFSFIIFGRSIGKSIDAMGRNPLARSAIMVSIFINAAITIMIILISIGASFLILNL